MPKKYQKGDENTYFPKVLAALIVFALAIATFIFSFVSKGPEDLEDYIIDEDKNGVINVSPGAGLATPSAPPSVVPPTFGP